MFKPNVQISLLVINTSRIYKLIRNKMAHKVAKVASPVSASMTTSVTSISSESSDSHPELCAAASSESCESSEDDDEGGRCWIVDKIGDAAMAAIV